MRSAEPGRRALLDAGRTLLATSDLSKLSVNSITATADMAKGSFYQHWPSRDDYILALHRAFHDHLFERVQERIADQRPGAERLATGIRAYLDGCLAEPATKALLVQARTEAALGDEVAQRNRQAADVLTADLTALGWSDPEPIAVLLVAAIAETALMELTDRGPRPDLRAALLRLAAPPRG
ncbi:Bacterial regulatory proteins, tetR family [Nocardia otitidiscaviarum]|uniref:Bacterial regulatory proteins, tetR family n=1 Tax=Nocardia otitidiscaviarum TaxID=1823 RepID=A0A379JHC7_9NOCA|nr:TetR/AcrR family transcriptional regulator [Nocardia otitidiscaviarum]SUD47875.1 Bacterial regulatory proteins, tetR family [Nocardia otitidiscaviarum]